MYTSIKFLPLELKEPNGSKYLKILRAKGNGGLRESNDLQPPQAKLIWIER